MLLAHKITEFIKKRSDELGFLSVGFSKAEFLEEDAPRLEKWLRQNMNGEMSYMNNHFDKRLNPSLLVEDAKSVVSFTYNYYTEKTQKDSNSPKISKYAFGRDYHKVIKKKLKFLFSELREEFGDIGGRLFVDSAPIMEKSWAVKSGLGWVGKNANIISKNSGSFFFLAEMILDVELEYSNQFSKDYCGTCTKCIDECPTDAIVSPKVIDAKKCISYLTIELKGEIPSEFSDKMNNWAFGCDVCQDVCPWNRFSLKHTEPDFNPSIEFINMSKNDWFDLTEKKFEETFNGTAIRRTKYKGLMRNLKFIKKSKILE